jgi:(heptosyl)LPS beta-1,4-glucosyltransferase
VKLTVTVITHNESRNIGAALESVSWADEIIVVDASSTDDTVAIAGRHGARIEVRPWSGYSDQKNFAAGLASHDWILSLDADERVTPGLAREIRDLLHRGPQHKGYRVSRVTYYLGRWLHSTDWYPDYQLRLYDRRCGGWNPRRVHESFELRDGRPGRLRHHLEHYAYRDVSDHVTSIDHYTTLAAEQWMTEGRRTNVLEIAVHPPIAFLRNYILRLGIRDGSTGFLVSALNSYYVFMKLVKLWEMQDRVSRNKSDLGPAKAEEGPAKAGRYEDQLPVPSAEPRAPVQDNQRAPSPESRAPSSDEHRAPSAKH